MARIPEVIAQVGASVVKESGGQITCPKSATNAVKFVCKTATKESAVMPFEIMNRCVPSLLWDVYIADTARQYAYDGLQGGNGCVEISIATSDDAEKSSHRAAESASDTSIISADSPYSDNLIPLADLKGFLEWISARTQTQWRFPTDKEYELMYEREQGVAVQVKNQVSQPSLGLAHSACTTDNMGALQWQTQCDPPIWEMTNNCLPETYDDNVSSTDPQNGECDGRLQLVVTLHVDTTESTDRKGRTVSTDSLWTAREGYSEHHLVRPPTRKYVWASLHDVGREHYPKAIRLRLVRQP